MKDGACSQPQEKVKKERCMRCGADTLKKDKDHKKQQCPSCLDLGYIEQGGTGNFI